MRKTVFFSLIFIFLIFNMPVPAAELTWSGCGITKYAFMEEVAKAFENKTKMHIKLAGGGATKGIRSVASKTGDFGGSCRLWLVLPDGNIHSQEANAELIPVAWDALVPIVHNENPVNDISIDQIRKILDGELENWADLGWKNSGKIIPCTREGKESGVGFMVRKIIFNNSNYDFKGRSLTFKSTSSLEQKIEISSRSFGLSGISSAKKRNLKIVSINGIYPSKENISSGKFPLYRPLFITIAKNDARPEVKMFVDFITGAEGQEIISKQGTVNWEEGKALVPLWEKNFPALKLP